MSLKSFFGMFELLEGSRKFLIMFLVLVAGLVFRLKGLVSGGEFVDLIKGCFIAFVGSNIGEHIINTVKDYVKTKAKDLT